MQMTRRDFMMIGGLGAAVAGLSLGPTRLAAAINAQAARENEAARRNADAATAAERRPDIIVILTDDQDTGTLEATMTEDGGVVPVMRHLLAGRGGGWVRFDNAVCNQAICAPSRASWLTGRYAHNHGVVKNGWVDRMADPDHTLARWLHDAGYFTLFRGKYSYGKRDSQARRPAGWDVWEPGGGYSSAVFPRGAQLIRQLSADTPVFACLWPVDPHAKARPPAAYAGREITLPADTPSVNEADVSDKPERIRRKKLLTKGKLSGLREERKQACRALAGVDDGIKLVFDTLEETGRLDNAVIVFAGDHGYLWGEHRLERKDSPYRPASGFPLLIRDPGLSESRREERLVSNVDLAATLAEYAGARPDVAIDGRSLVALIRDGAAAWWDEAALIEKNMATALDPGTYRGVYAVVDGGPWCYVRHSTGEVELYDLATDPDQMSSLHNAPGYQGVRAALDGRMTALAAGAAWPTPTPSATPTAAPTGTTGTPAPTFAPTETPTPAW